MNVMNELWIKQNEMNETNFRMKFEQTKVIKKEWKRTVLKMVRTEFKVKQIWKMKISLSFFCGKKLFSWVEI